MSGLVKRGAAVLAPACGLQHQFMAFTAAAVRGWPGYGLALCAAARGAIDQVQANRQQQRRPEHQRRSAVHDDENQVRHLNPSEQAPRAVNALYAGLAGLGV